MDKQEKQFVRIQSDETINVTMGLSYNDVTNPDAHIPDRLKVQPSWASTTVLIKKGTGFYPAYIANWSTVQRLVEDKILTIGEFTDEASEEEKEVKAKLDLNIAEVKNRMKQAKSLNLSALAGDKE